VKVAALFSGGKDSTFSIYKAKEMGHDVECLVCMNPPADDSLFFHYPNIWITALQAKCMQTPSFQFFVEKRSMKSELEALENAIKEVKALYDIHAIVHGAISSEFQEHVFKRICRNNGLLAIAPLWKAPSLKYMHDLVMKFDVKIVSVSAMGLERSWLGKSLDKISVDVLHTLSKKNGFNLNFEGGEAETLVVDCPLFQKRLEIRKANVIWDGQRGIFEILEVALIRK
jgi:diphthine-ammonia ligase